jgi:hypothetical protein
MDRFSEDPGLYVWYAAKTVANRWPVRQLQTQIHLGLHQRQGAVVSNFAEVLGSPDGQTVLEATKDPYVFDFLELAEDAQERQLEQALHGAQRDRRQARSAPGLCADRRFHLAGRRPRRVASGRSPRRGTRGSLRARRGTGKASRPRRTS